MLRLRSLKTTKLNKLLSNLKEEKKKLISKIILTLLLNCLLTLFIPDLGSTFSADLKHKTKNSSTPTANAQDDKKALETILNEWSLHDVNWTREQLENIVKKSPRNYEAWYWIAVASHRDLDDSKRAKEALAKVLKANPKQPAWLMPWSYFRLGMIASSDGQKEEAIKFFNKVLSFKDDGSGYQAAAQEELDKLN